MEIRGGYKKTEIGIIPKEWEVKKLKQISPSISVGLVINPSTYYDERGTVPMLVGSNIKENNILWDKANHISEFSNNKIPASRLKAGDLVTVRVGEPGITAVIPPEHNNCNCASMMIVRKCNMFDSYWLCFVMNSTIGMAQIAHVQYGTAQKQFNISDAIDFVYPFPPLSEQTAIATAISDADALITSFEKLIAKKCNLKQGAMQQLLTGKKRLPGFSGKWEKKTLSEICELINGFSFKSSTYDDKGEYLIITIANVQDGFMITFECNKIVDIPSELQHHQRLKKGDILISMTGNVGRVCRVNIDNALLNQRVGKLIPTYCEGSFLYYLLNDRKFVSSMIISAQGGAQGNISKYDILSYATTVPQNRDEQIAIAQVLADMDAEIDSLEHKLEKYKLIKQGMMQELLTGKTRLISS